MSENKLICKDLKKGDWGVSHNIANPDCIIDLFSYDFINTQGMIALRREATELTHEDYMDGILEVQSKKKANLNYYA